MRNAQQILNATLETVSTLNLNEAEEYTLTSVKLRQDDFYINIAQQGLHGIICIEGHIRDGRIVGFVTVPGKQTSWACDMDDLTNVLITLIETLTL